MTVETEIVNLVASRLAEAWPGTSLATDPTPLTGGFWASMYRLRLDGQPNGVPADVVFRIAPDSAMGAKEFAVQQTVADMGYPTPRVRLTGTAGDDLGGSWSVMDFASGTPPLGDLNGIAALRRAPKLFANLPGQLAVPMARLHALDPEPVSSAVRAAAPTVAWSVGELLEHFETAADALRRPDLAAAIRVLTERRPSEHDRDLPRRPPPLQPARRQPWRGHGYRLDCRDPRRAGIRRRVHGDAACQPAARRTRSRWAVIRWIGRRLAHRFVARYRTIAPQHDLDALDWYRALHGSRILIEAATLEARHGPGGGGHPFGALMPAAVSALRAVTGAPIATPS